MGEIHGHHVGAPQSHGVGENYQRWKHNERRQESRNDEIGDRIVGERLEGVDLFSDAHRPDLDGHTRANATGEHEPREQGPKLENDHQS